MPGVSVGNIHLAKYGFFTCRHPNVVGPTTFLRLNTGASATALPAYPTGEALEIISSSTEDDAGTPGTGMLTCRVVYLDGTTGTITSAVVSLDGTTQVALADTTITRIISMHGVTFGSAGAAVGTITIRTVTGSFGRMAIDPGFRSAFPGRFTIPDGYTGYYRGFDLEHGSASVTAPSNFDYLIRADLAPNAGTVTSNNFIDLDVGTSAVGTGKSGGGPRDSVFGQNLPLPAGTTIEALARHNTVGLCPVAGRVYVELTNVEL